MAMYSQIYGLGVVTHNKLVRYLIPQIYMNIEKTRCRYMLNQEKYGESCAALVGPTFNSLRITPSEAKYIYSMKIRPKILMD